MENSREDIKNGLLKKINESVTAIDYGSSGIAHEWVTVFGKFLSALEIEANLSKMEK